MANHNKLGERGERIAKDFLKELGYEIIEMNWREQKYEIDIIAIDEEEVVFVEVKTRSSSHFGTPEEAVTFKKQKHLIEGADYYLHKNEIDRESRFDVISIINNADELTLNHFQGAFYPQA